MNDEVKDFFILYSYVHINYNHEKALIINTETHGIYCTTNDTFVEIFTNLSLPTIHYMLPITEDSKRDKEFMDFMNKLEAEFCGEFIRTTFLNIPIQFSPQFTIGNNIPLKMLSEFSEKHIDTELIRGFKNEIGNNILLNVLELSIYYNTQTSNLFNADFPIHRQYLYPLVDAEYSCLYNMSSIFEYIFPRLCKINLIVGRLTETDIVSIKNIIEKHNLYKKIDLYTVSSEFGNISAVFIDLFSTIHVWHNTSSEIVATPKGVINFLLVENEEDVSIFENNSNIHDIYPLYNGKNDLFCHEYLSFDVEDLMIDRKISDREIMINQHINSNLFGEISIYPNGEVYSCKSRVSIGNINHSNIKDIVFEELNLYKHWYLTRNSIPCCRKCVFNWICPPVTHNELEMDKFDFCNNTRKCRIRI